MTIRASYKHLKEILHTFIIPICVLMGILCSIFFTYIIQIPLLTFTLLAVVIVMGSYQLVFDTMKSLVHRRFALDYIALLAITVGVLTGNFLVAAIIVLMLSGGQKLEEYGLARAKSSLSSLIDRIPNTVMLADTSESRALDQIRVGTHILVRKGEVIPLDGFLISESGLTDESSLTGEPYIIDKEKGDIMRSGTVNMGNPIEIEVTKVEKDSTYHKIIEMVKNAQNEKAPLIRLADQYSAIFTIATLCIAGVAYFVSHDFTRVLAVLVIATPCPLILATPIALMGGMSAAARHRIIVKRLSGIEVLARITTIIFDKTGTITLGKPFISDIIIHDSSLTRGEIVTIAAAIERNSLHPLAKAITRESKDRHIRNVIAQNVHEEIGQGIIGTINGKTYKLAKSKSDAGMAIEMTRGATRVAQFIFEDKIKPNSKETVLNLQKEGLDIHIFTGDKRASADLLVEKLGADVKVLAQSTPEDKKNGIIALHKKGKTVAMVGDGINDAPALAMADVGMVFSNHEHTAASEAADIVFLGGDFSTVSEVLLIARRTISIAKQSIFFGIGCSILGMLFAGSGYIPPIMGAFLQEAIDIAVIFNALRASVYNS